LFPQEPDVDPLRSFVTRPLPNHTQDRAPGDGPKSRPVWSADGNELFFIEDDVKLMAAPVSTTPTLSIGEPKLICADLDVNLSAGTCYAPMPDGQRFLVIKEDPAFLTPRKEIHVVVNWIEELKAKMNP
jgi:hypothetical protein